MNRDDDEFRISIKVRNHPLLSAIEARADSVADFCRKFDLSQSEVGELLNLKRNPINQMTGEWRRPALQVADACGVPPEDLFPSAVQLALSSNHAQYTLNRREVMAALREADQRPDALLQQKETAAEVLRVIETVKHLTVYERKVLVYRFGLGGGQEKTATEVARMFDLSVARVQQIEAKALRKMRHPSRSEQLLPLLPASFEDIPPPQDTFGMDAWVEQAVEQGLATWIPPLHPAVGAFYDPYYPYLSRRG